MAAPQTSNTAGLRIVVGCDNAGHTYKEALKETLKKHKGVIEVLDVGVDDQDDDKAYPHSAVDAARKIKNGEVRQTFARACSDRIYGKTRRDHLPRSSTAR